MSTAPAIAVAVTFVWLGMVLAISFLEAPLKFRAPGVTLQVGLGIGRLVFRALNAVEVIAAIVTLAALAAGSPSAGATGAAPTRFSPGRTRRVRMLITPTSPSRGPRQSPCS